MFYVISKYQSKYGLIVYATKVSSAENIDIDLNNCYISTLYYKGSSDISVGSVYSFQTIKGENGLTYCFL